MLAMRPLTFLAPGLASWLNGPLKKQWRREITQLIRSLKEVGTKRRSPIGKMYWAAQMIVLTQLLRGHKFFPVIVESPDRRCLVVDWRIDAKTSKAPDLSSHVFGVLILFEQGDLWRVRQCKICNSWMAARSRNQTACSTNCRQKRYRESPKGKRKHKRYMKKYYKEHRDTGR